MKALCKARVTRRTLPSCSSCKSTAKRKLATYKVYTDLQKALEDRGSGKMRAHRIGNALLGACGSLMLS